VGGHTHGRVDLAGSVTVLFVTTAVGVVVVSIFEMDSVFVRVLQEKVVELFLGRGRVGHGGKREDGGSEMNPV
jgi:hypothetical protein